MNRLIVQNKTLLNSVLKSNVCAVVSTNGLSNNASSQNGQKKDGSTYQVPEFFKYNQYSYFDFDVEMSKYRLKQPSALQPLQPPQQQPKPQPPK